MFVEVHEHILFQGSLAVVNADAVVVAVQAVDEGLDGGLVEVSQVRCALPRFLTHDE